MSLDGIISLDQYLLTLINGSNSLFLDSIVPMLTSAITWIPLYIGLLYIVVKNNETMAQIGLAVGGALVCIVLSGGIDDFIIKPLVARPRPCNDLLFKCQLDLVKGTLEQSYSFFSAHAANTMSLAVFVCLLVRDRILGVTMIFWSLLNCWTRLYLGVHYPFDVLAGILWGVGIGFLVYYLYKKIYLKFNPKFHYISSQYTSTGYAKSDVDVVLTIFVVTIAVVVLGAVGNIQL